MTRPAPPLVAGDTPRKSVEGELARFFGYSHDVLAILTGEGRVLMISPSVERVLGHPIDEIVGERLLHWVHPEDRAPVNTETRNLLEGRPVADLHTRMRRADGGWLPMSWSLAVGPHRRLYAVGRDRTDAIQRREALMRQEMAELRLRTAMELHDGILQTLTGASLQIAVARCLVRKDPAAAEEVLDDLLESVAAEQREIRLYVDEVRGKAEPSTDETLDLSERIETIIKRVGMTWSLDTSTDVRIPEGIAPELGRRVLRIIQEAIVNAARHGAAQEVSVAVIHEGSEITITVAGDGWGFPFRGEYDHEALKEKRLGPVSLKHRVEEIGGRISVKSTSGGSEVIVRVPLPGEGPQ